MEKIEMIIKIYQQKKNKLKHTQEWKITTEIDYLTRPFEKLSKFTILSI